LAIAKVRDAGAKAPDTQARTRRLRQVDDRKIRHECRDVHPFGTTRRLPPTPPRRWGAGVRALLVAMGDIARRAAASGVEAQGARRGKSGGWSAGVRAPLGALVVLVVSGGVAGRADAGSVVEAQKARRSESGLAGGAAATAPFVLTNLNPRVNAWLLLTPPASGGKRAPTINLLNTFPQYQRVHLASVAKSGKDGGPALVLVDYRSATRCAVTEIQRAFVARDGRPYVPVCGGRLAVRRQRDGQETTLEWATDLMRRKLPFAETLLSLAKTTIFADNARIAAVPGGAAASAAARRLAQMVERGSTRDGLPPAAALLPDVRTALAVPSLGIPLRARPQALRVGHWYPARDEPGVAVSAVAPRYLPEPARAADRARLAPLDAVERDAVAFLVSFDLARFSVGFGVGTKHPAVGWSRRAAVPHVGPGPDGFADLGPLAPTGLVSPAFASRLVATFAGGFKRDHGAFKSGAFAQRNDGSHYGFIEDGVVLSRLVPGLATFWADTDGAVGLGTWTGGDARAATIRYARQNGVPLVEPDGAGGGRPGALVARWGDGNWSGDVKAHERSLRAGLCRVDGNGGRFLVYGLFTSATPNAMARVFQAYGCSYAMHLDMNAVEHTYFALLHDAGTEARATWTTEPVLKEMARYDGHDHGVTLPRFVARPDNRDFFFVYRRDDAL
jgi:hypothetical protein